MKNAYKKRENENFEKQKNKILGQKVCPVACLQTDTQTDRVSTVGTLSGFQDFFLSAYHQGSSQKPYGYPLLCCCEIPKIEASVPNCFRARWKTISETRCLSSINILVFSM